MSLIESTFNLLHHTQQAPTSLLDMVLLIIKSLTSVIGTFVILVGVIVALKRFWIFRFAPKKNTIKNLGMDYIRRDLGRTIVLGLEFIIAADVIETTTTPDYYSLGILALIVVIRTFLSFTLTREISQLSPSQQKNLTD